MSRYVDHTPERPDGAAPIGRCVVLPGTRYTPDSPLLFFATQVALAHGWEVRQVWWDVPDLDDAAQIAWVGRELGAALDGHDGRVVVVGKSLGTLAGDAAAGHGYDAAWLTPLLTEPDVARPLRTYPAAQYVLIGTEDPYLDREVLDALPGEHVLVTGDHVLRVPGDPIAMMASHERFVRSFDTWLGGVAARR